MEKSTAASQEPEATSVEETTAEAPQASEAPAEPSDTEAGPVSQRAASRTTRALAWTAGVLFASTVVFLRLWHLDLRPIQHDETLFGWWGWLTYTNGYYDTLPSLHGPVIFWALAGMFHLSEALGMQETDATLRLFTALCGIGLFIPLWTMRRTFGTFGTWAAAVCVALSPTLLYFSRFCRTDILFLLATMVIVACLTQYGRSRGARPLAGALFAFAVSVAIKETYLIFGFLLVTFAVGTAIHARAQKRPLAEAPVTDAILFALKRRRLTLVLATVAGALFIVAIFTSWFHTGLLHHWDGPWEAFSLWVGEHSKRRIKGEFHFHVLHLGLYEAAATLWWVGSLLVTLWQAMRRVWSVRYRVVFFVWAGVSLALLVALGGTHLPPVFDSLLHMSRGFHVWMLIQVGFVVAMTSYHHLCRGRVMHAWLDYWAGGSLLIYSYAGEKVPWVGAHIALPMALSCGLYAAYAWRWSRDALLAAREGAETPKRAPKLKAALAVALVCSAALGMVWQARVIRIAVFEQPGEPIERHSFAGAHTQFKVALDEVLAEAFTKHDGYATPVAFQGEVEWPLHWSLRRFQTRYWGPHVPPDDPQAIYYFTDSVKFETLRKEPWVKRYQWSRVPFRHYWTPVPLDTDAMWQAALAWAGLGGEPDAAVKQGQNEWCKLWTTVVLRTQGPGDCRWNRMGGHDALIGRRTVPLPTPTPTPAPHAGK